MAARSRSSGCVRCADLRACPPHAGTDPLDDETALKFSDDTDDHDDRPAQRAAGVDLFPEADELNMPANWEASSSVRPGVSRISWIMLPKSRVKEKLGAD